MQEANMKGGGEVADLSIHVAPRLELVLETGPCAGQTLAPKGYCLTVGRTRASKMHIKDPSISEKHCDMCWDGQHWLLRDSGSSNGTYHNGRRLSPLGRCSCRVCACCNVCFCVSVCTCVMARMSTP